MQYTSWEGRLVKWYKDNLGLRGGYVRWVDRSKPPSIANSEYVKSTDLYLVTVARSGKLINPIRQPKQNYEPHYNNNYGNPISSKKEYEREVKRAWEKKLRQLKRRKNG